MTTDTQGPAAETFMGSPSTVEPVFPEIFICIQIHAASKNSSCTLRRALEYAVQADSGAVDPRIHEKKTLMVFIGTNKDSKTEG